MITNIYTVFDSKARIYTRPFYAMNDAHATRMCVDAASNRNLETGQHPEDFSCFHIGSYDDSNALISAVEPVRHICNFHEVQLSLAVPNAV